MDDRFRLKTGGQFSTLADAALVGGMPHHSYHVFCIYPWVGLLGDDRRYEQALMVLDRCRIRWGQVRQVLPAPAGGRSQPLLFEHGRLFLGTPRSRRSSGPSTGSGWRAACLGDWVSNALGVGLRPVSARQLAGLRHYTGVHLDIVNNRLHHPGAITALG